MESLSSPTAQSKLSCVLGCQKFKFLYKFPLGKESRRTWLDKIGLRELPCSLTAARICNNHFSKSMYSQSGRRLTHCALPDVNIPDNQVESTPVRNIKVFRPTMAHNDINLDEIPLTVFKPEIITSRDSLCFLRCKDTENTFQFPQDIQSLQIWMKQLGISKTPPRSTAARLCQNHFSARMFTPGIPNRLTSCAIPDINLPGQTVFKEDETDSNKTVDLTKSPDHGMVKLDIVRDVVEVPEAMANVLQGEEEVHELFRAVMDTPSVAEPAATKIIGRPEVLINTIENIKSAVNSTTNKEGILHVFQPGIESKAEDIDYQNRVILPEAVVDAASECVLKCPHGDRLFRFPNNEEQRKIWLSKVGLTHCFFNTKICDRHFSERMFIKSGKRLAKLAFPDINLPEPPQPRIADPKKSLKNYRMILPSNKQYDVVELPQYICVLTILKGHTEVDAVVNGIKYVCHKVDENMPKREREVQVNASDLIKMSNVGISPEDYVEDIDFQENTECEQLNWINMFKSHVLASKADMYECLICGEISVGYACNIKHANVHKESSVLCFQCGRLFSNQYMLKIHERDTHFNRLGKALRCPKKFCKKAFRSRKLLHLHVDEHTRRNLQYKCGKCPRQFFSLLRLHSHQLACRGNLGLKYSRRFLRK